MAKLTVKELDAKIQAKPGRFTDGDGLYFVVPKSGKFHWMFRYTENDKRKEMKLAKYESLSLANLHAKVAENIWQHCNISASLLAIGEKARNTGNHKTR